MLIVCVSVCVDEYTLCVCLHLFVLRSNSVRSLMCVLLRECYPPNVPITLQWCLLPYYPPITLQFSEVPNPLVLQPFKVP